MSVLYTPTTQDFLSGGATGVLPSGKKIFISDIGRYKMRLQSRLPVTWYKFNSSGNGIGTFVQPANSFTPQIDNSFYSKSSNKVYIQYLEGSNTVQAELNNSLFDMNVLDTLPSTQQQIDAATATANQAVEVQNMEGKTFIERLLYSLTNVDIKKAATIAGIGIIAIIALKNSNRH